MPFVIIISGSPSTTSKTSSLIALTSSRLQAMGIIAGTVYVRDLDPPDLIYGRYNSPAILNSIALIRQAQGVIVATPIYKSSFSGVLKTYLDLLPSNIFGGKVVLPLATGGNAAQTLALDYALRPVLVTLGAEHMLRGVYVLDESFLRVNGTTTQLDFTGEEQLTHALVDLARALITTRSTGSEQD